MVTTRTEYFLMMVGITAALMAVGSASEVVEAPAVEPVAAEAPMAEAVMDPNAPVTQARPVYAVGSSWTVDYTLNGETQRYTSTIVEKWEIDGREVNVHARTSPERDPGFPCDGANGDMVDAVTHNWMGCLKDGEILASLSPHVGLYAWPLEVGKSWWSETVWTDNVIHPEWSGPGWAEWTVVAWEEVTVPAGTFMAYKVVRTKESWETTSEDIYITWYAPEFGGSIKGILVRGKKDGYGPAERMWEMVSLDPK